MYISIPIVYDEGSEEYKYYIEEIERERGNQLKERREEGRNGNEYKYDI